MSSRDYMPWEEVIATAEKHSQNENIVMKSSALACLEDAKKAADRYMYATARNWAAKSLAYSVGISHPDYIRVKYGNA